MKAFDRVKPIEGAGVVDIKASIDEVLKALGKSTDGSFVFIYVYKYHRHYFNRRLIQTENNYLVIRRRTSRK